CATGCSPFVSYWMHGEMLNFKGAKLSKSTGGNITLEVLKENNFSPLDYRYLTLQTHYRSPMEFNFDILEQAKNALARIRKDIIKLKKETDGQTVDILNHPFRLFFLEKIQDDMNIPQALATFHEMMKSDIPDIEKLSIAYDFDRIFGLGFENYSEEEIDIPESIQKLLDERKIARENKDFVRSDELRDEIRVQGYDVIDEQGTQTITKHS